MPIILISIASAALLLAMWGYFGWLHWKAWVCDEPSPNLDDTRVARVAHIFGEREPWPDVLAFCVAVWLALLAVCIIASTPAWKVALPIALLSAVVFAGSHAVRWAMRTRRSLGELNQETHKHNEEE